MSVAAILNERRLKRRFDADDLREIDIALEGLAARGFEVEFFKSRSIDHNDPGFFRVTCVDEHARWPWARSERRVDPYRWERPAAMPPLSCEGSGASSTRRTTNSGQDGKLRAAGPQLGPANLEDFLIATACLTVSPQIGRAPISARAQASLARKLPSERDPKARYERRRPLADATYGVRNRADNQKIVSSEFDLIALLKQLEITCLSLLLV